VDGPETGTAPPRGGTTTWSGPRSRSVGAELSGNGHGTSAQMDTGRQPRRVIGTICGKVGADGCGARGHPTYRHREDPDPDPRRNRVWRSRRLPVHRLKSTMSPRDAVASSPDADAAHARAPPSASRPAGVHADGERIRVMQRPCGHSGRSGPWRRSGTALHEVGEPVRHLVYVPGWAKAQPTWRWPRRMTPYSREGGQPTDQVFTPILCRSSRKRGSDRSGSTRGETLMKRRNDERSSTARSSQRKALSRSPSWP
jgi:hypothetical protein